MFKTNDTNMYYAIDMHCDTISEIYKRNLSSADFRSNTQLSIDAERLNAGNYACQCFALYSTPEDYEQYNMTPFEYFKELSNCMDNCLAENADLIQPALTGTQIKENIKNGKVSALKTVEEGMVYEGRLENLKTAYDMGVRMSTLTWNYENELAFPNPSVYDSERGMNVCVGTDTINGLKPAGFEFIEAMEELGIIIDIAHLNDAGIYDIFNTVKRSTPIIASHSNARACCNHPRNLSDDMLRAIAEHGGVAGINFCPVFLNESNLAAKTENETTSRIEDMIRHMKHMKNVAGIDTVALGSDLDGIGGNLEIDGADKMPLLAKAMDAAGFTDNEIEKVFYANTLRVFIDVLG